MPLTKQITYETVTSIGTQIEYNQRVTTIDKDGNSLDQYYPARASIYMTGTAPTGETNQVIREVLLGIPKTTPYTPQQLFTMIKSAQGLPALAPGLKQAYTDAVNVTVA